MTLRNWIEQGQNLLKEFLDKPESSTSWIKQLPEPVSKRVLAYASELLEPSFWGTGLRIRDLKRERIWLELPLRRRQSLSSGELQAGALLSTAEWAFRLLWSQQGHMSHSRVWLSHGEVELDGPLSTTVWLRGEFPLEMIERVQFELMKTGKVQEEWAMSILNTSERQIGRVHLQLNWSSDLLLAAPKA